MTFDEIMKFAPGLNGNKKIFEKLVNMYKNQSSDIIPYIGAGLSVDVGYPDWKGVLEKICGEINKFSTRKRIYEQIKKGSDYETVASEIENIIGGRVYNGIREMFAVKPGVDYRDMAINTIPYLFDRVITTNYDCVIEDVFAKNGQHINVARPTDTFLFYNALIGAGNTCVYKLHGDIVSDEKDIVFTKDSYDRHYQKESHLCTELGNLCNARKLLFLGASLRQDRMAGLLINLGHEGNEHFAIMPCKKRGIDEERKRLRGMHIDNAILYPDKKHECVKIILERLLQEVKPDIYHRMFECNMLSSAAIYSVELTQKIMKEDFITPYFRMKETAYGKEPCRIYSGLDEFYGSIRSEDAECFFVVDGKTAKKQQIGRKVIYGGGGMGKSTVLAKTYIDNRTYSLLFILKDYTMGSRWGEKIINKCLSGEENWILFDGLNEMSEENFKSFEKEILEALVKIREEKCNKNRKVKLVFSARNAEIFESLDNSLFSMAKKRIYEICYDETDFWKFFERNGIEVSEDMMPILQTPLFASLYVKTNRTLHSILGDRKLTEFAEGDMKGKLYNRGEILWNYICMQKYKFSDKNTNEETEEIITNYLPRLAKELHTRNIQSIYLKEYCKIIGKENEKNDVKRVLKIAERNLNLIAFYENTGIGESRISFVHEEFLDFFAALYLVQQLKKCIENDLLYSPGDKNPTDNVRRYSIEIQRGEALEEYIENEEKLNGKKQHKAGCATAEACLGDLYYYKSQGGYLSRITETIEEETELLKKAYYYYDLEKENGDPMGLWNIVQTDRVLYRLAKTDSEKEKIEKEIYEYSLEALEKENALRETLLDKGEAYYGILCDDNIKFSSRIACMENQMAIVFLYGFGIKTDLQRAKAHFRKGILYEYAYSYNRLAQMYEKEVYSVLDKIVSGSTIDVEELKKMKVAYVTAFLIFWKQIQDVGERYGMFEGISIETDNTVSFRQQDIILQSNGKNERTRKNIYSVKLKWDWIGKFLNESPEIGLFEKEQEKLKNLKDRYERGKLKDDVIQWLKSAAFAQDKFAIERLQKVESGQLEFE